MKAPVLILLYLVAVTSPLILSWAVGDSPRSVRIELASGLGILSFSIILAEFILSGRFKRVSREIGMDVTMRFHQVMARTAVAFALVHPFLYPGSPSGGPRPWDPSRQLTITTNFSDLSSGVAAFLLLPSLVALAIGRKYLDYKYETWRLMHGIGALAIAVLLLHHTISAGRYGAQRELVILWVAMTGIATGSLCYVYAVVPLLQRSAPWRVAAVTQLTPKQWTITVTPTGHSGLTYKAGQFVWLNIGNSVFSLYENPFSMSSAPAAGKDVSFLIKEVGDFTRTIGQIKPGSRAYLDGPHGNLSVEGRDEPGIALIAGGVGLAPLLGILRQLRLTKDPRQVRLVYGNRTEEQIVLRDELDGPDVVYVLSQPPNHWTGETGVIDAALIDKVFSVEELQSWVFVLCGPNPMLDGIEDHLTGRGVSSDRVLSERFEYD
jgi:predicted ferric reductase